jgi:arginine N-succinyltransferase
MGHNTESSVAARPIVAQAHSRLVVRPARPADLEGLYDLAVSAGPGMTNLPPDRDYLSARLAGVSAALGSEAVRYQGVPILFVLEQVSTGEASGHGAIVGTACIFPRIGVEWPFYSYRMTRQAQTTKAMGKTIAHDLLITANDFDGGAEVGGLFVNDSVRGVAAGRLAARSRYLFMAQHRPWFGRQVISDMRGYQDENGHSPVWEALGREFYDMDFADADRMNALAGNQFIADLAPKHPIYTRLLPAAAREALGRPHDDGRRAMALLIEEGFRFEGYVDIFDGGPTLFANIDDLKAVRESRMIKVAGVAAGAGSGSGSGDWLISAGDGAAFRSARGPLAIDADKHATLDTGLAAALGARPGDWVRYVSF